MNNLIHSMNVEKEVSHLTESIINDALKTRYQQAYNFEVITNHKDYLYNLLIEKSKNVLNNFTIADKNFRVWCYFTDDTYYKGDTWHNHISTSTINGVLYLQTVRGCGIEICTDYNVNDKFNIADKDYNRRNIKYMRPNNFDLLIFPNFLDHRPIPSKSKNKRITLNMELRCKEPSYTIFKGGNH